MQLLSVLMTLGIAGNCLAEIDQTQQTGTIQFGSATYLASEKDGQVAITVTREGGSSGALSIDVLAGGEVDTAFEPGDYTFGPTGSGYTLNWADGDASVKTVIVDLVSDNKVEGDERATLYFQLSGNTIGNTPLGSPGQTILTIQDSTTDPLAVDQIKTMAGNYQQGGEGDVLNPFQITALNSAGAPVAGVTVEWAIVPVTGGTLLLQTTSTDNLGQSSNTLTLNTSDRVLVTATVAANAGPANLPAAISHTNGAVTATFVVNGDLADQPGLSENQRSVAKAMDTLCTALMTMGNERSAEQEDLLNTCSRLGSDDPATLGESLDALAHEEVSAQGRVIIDSGKLQSASIHRRLAALRTGSRGVNLAGLNIQVDGKKLPASLLSELFGSQAAGGSAGGEIQGIASRWGAFINADVITGDRDKTMRESGYSLRSQGVTAGVDYRISDQLVVGSALGYGKNKSDFSGNSGNMEMENLHLSAYGSYYRSASFYLDGLLRVGKNSIDTRRQMSLSGAPQQNGMGSTKGWEYAASVSGGYEYSRNALTLGPYGRLGYIRATIDSYTETASNTGGAGMGSVLTMADQSVGSLTSVLGGMATYAISASNAVYLLQMTGEWAHEFKDNSRAISAQFYYDPTRTSFNIYSDSPDRDYFNLGLGATGVFANGKSAFIYYESRLGQDNIQLNWINAGFRLEL